MGNDCLVDSLPRNRTDSLPWGLYGNHIIFINSSHPGVSHVVSLDSSKSFQSHQIPSFLLLFVLWNFDGHCGCSFVFAVMLWGQTVGIMRWTGRTMPRRGQRREWLQMCQHKFRWSLLGYLRTAKTYMCVNESLGYTAKRHLLAIALSNGFKIAHSTFCQKHSKMRGSRFPYNFKDNLEK